MAAGDRVRFPAAGDGAVVLEGRLRLPEASVRGHVVLAHPHPAFGGSMDNWLLPTTAARLAGDGWAVLRLNFRGTAGSQGAFGGGLAEVDDLRGALAHLRTTSAEDLPAALVGWSFGALVALRAACAEPAVGHWLGIAPVTRQVADVPIAGPIPPDVRACRARRTVIVGEHEQFYPVADAPLLDPAEVILVPGADHFFFDRDADVAELVAGALRPVLG